MTNFHMILCSRDFLRATSSVASEGREKCLVTGKWRTLLKRNILLGLLMLCSVCLAYSSQEVQADSLWTDQGELSYATYRPHQVGDIITIVIDEESLAEHTADTDTSTKSEAGVNVNSTWGGLNKLLSGSPNDLSDTVGGSGSLKYRGKGKTQRASEVRSRITATVVAVSPNGNLTVVGKKSVKVNDETEEVSVKGIVRPQDVTPENTVLSHQIANAEISVQGAGTLGDKQSPGPMMRFFDWLF